MYIKFSVQETYGVMAILALAQHVGDAPLQVKVIAQRHGISTRFLAQVMGRLKNEGLVQSVRGRQGGYRLARRPEEIRIRDVVRAIEGTPRVARAATQTAQEGVLAEIQIHINTVLGRLLDDLHFQALAERVAQREARHAPMFHI